MPLKSKQETIDIATQNLDSVLKFILADYLDLVKVVAIEVRDETNINTATILFKVKNDEMPSLQNVSKNHLTDTFQNIFDGDFPQFNNTDRLTFPPNKENWPTAYATIVRSCIIYCFIMFEKLFYV